MAQSQITLEAKEIKVPITVDEHGTARIGCTRVTLMSFIASYKQGATVQDIKNEFPSLQLADIHSTIAYYLNHQEEVDSYLTREAQIGCLIVQILESDLSDSEKQDKIKEAISSI